MNKSEGLSYKEQMLIYKQQCEEQANYILELIEKSMPDEEANEKIFLLLEKTLRILSQMQNNYL